MTELLPPFISQTLRDGTPQVQICYYVTVLVKIEKNNVINEDLHTFMADSVNSVTIYLPSLPYLPRLSEFISLLKLCKRAVIAVLTFHNFFHLMWFVHKR